METTNGNSIDLLLAHIAPNFILTSNYLRYANKAKRSMQEAVPKKKKNSKVGEEQL